jgi:hypothetical protein
MCGPLGGPTDMRQPQEKGMPVKRAIRPLLLVLLSIAVLGSPGIARAGTVAVHVERLTLTSMWRTPSPDPTGLAYDPSRGRLFISDSEVDETPLWKHRNLFIVSRTGHLQAARKLTRVTVEPEDLAFDNGRRILFTVDDDHDLVFTIRAGPDGKFGTRDDKRSELANTNSWGCANPEGLGWKQKGKMLLLTDATDNRVFKLRRGPDRRFGTSDDVVRSFGTSRFGFREAEDIAFEPASGHLFIVSSQEKVILETRLGGRLVQRIDLSSTNIRNPSGIVVAPARDGSGNHLFVTDRGKDNDPYPGENDGRLYEFSIV